MGTYAGIATAAAVGTAGTIKYKRDRAAARKSQQRKTNRLAAAGGLTGLAAVAAAGYFGKQAYDRKYSGQDHGLTGTEDDEEFADEVSDTPSGTKKASSGAKGKAKGKKRKQPEKTNWLLWGFLLVLGLAAIGGAVYYFLFTDEEGSEEDAVPEGGDMV